MIAIVLLISGCGSSVSTGDGGSGANGTSAAREQAVKFAECIRSNGIAQFPDPNASGEFTYGIPSKNSPLDPNSAAWQSAIAACKSQEPSGFMPTSFSATQRAARHKFAQCVRAHGVPNFPDPTSNGPLINVQNAQSIPGLQAAIHTCTELNPEATQ